MGDRISMSISVDSLSDETLKLGPWCPRVFPFWINAVGFSFSFQVPVQQTVLMKLLKTVKRKKDKQTERERNKGDKTET